MFQKIIKKWFFTVILVDLEGVGTKRPPRLRMHLRGEGTAVRVEINQQMEHTAYLPLKLAFK